MKPCVPIGLLALLVWVASGDASDAGDLSGPAGRTGRTGSGIVSPRLSAAIQGSLPTYGELVEKSAPKADDGSEEGVVVLKTMHVIERREPTGIDWQMLTEEGKADLLKERYMGATIPGARLTEAMHNYGMAMQREDTRIARLAEINGSLDAAEAMGDAGYLRELKGELYKTRMRPNDMRLESMDRSVNRYRQP